LPTFFNLANMTREDLNSHTAAAATVQVKLCLYDEEEPHFFLLIEAPCAVAGIKSQKLKYANAIVSPEISQIQFACSAAAPPANILPSAAPSASFCLSSLTPVPAPVLIPPPTAKTSSQPLAVSAYLVRNPEVKSSSFSFRENRSLLDSPPSSKKIPDSEPDDVKTLLQKFPSILHTGDVKPAPNHGVEHHIHTGSHPPIFAKSRCLNLEKLQIAKVEFKRLESAGFVRRSKSPWASPLHMVPKKIWIVAALF
jgi:hypothetical protein